jgi:hypothetical protein
MFRRFVVALVTLTCCFANPAFSADKPTPIVPTTLDDKSSFADYIKALGVKMFLSGEDARTYSSDLSDLVGSYFYVDDNSMTVLMGRPDAIPKATAVQLKDKIEYQSATDKGASLSATLPWLSFLFKSDKKTSILMQDIASIVGTSDPATIKANIPAGIAPTGKQVWFITGATVTLVSATLYSNKSFNGSTIIQVGGNALHSQNILQNAWIISLNKVPTGTVGLHGNSLNGAVITIKKTN